MPTNLTTVEGILAAVIPHPADETGEVLGLVRRGDKAAASGIVDRLRPTAPDRADYLSSFLSLADADIIRAANLAGGYCSKNMADKTALYNFALMAEAIHEINKADFALNLALQAYAGVLRLDPYFIQAEDSLRRIYGNHLGIHGWSLTASGGVMPHLNMPRFQSPAQPSRNPLTNLRRAMIEVPTVADLMKIFGWTRPPLLERDDIYDVEHDTDANDRRIRDAEALGVVLRNAGGKVALEIGTCTGAGTALMAANAPETQIHTINIAPEDIVAGEGGRLTTVALERERIGQIYRQKGYANVTQIYANTLHWQPNIGMIDVAFVDGCHDTEFVINDTSRIMPFMSRDGFVLWHDCNLGLIDKFDWIYEVCLGLEKLLEAGVIGGPIYNLRHSWIGIMRVS